METSHFGNILDTRAETHPGDSLRPLYCPVTIIKAGSICRSVNILARPFSLIKEPPSTTAESLEFHILPDWFSSLTSVNKRRMISITRQQNVPQRSNSIIAARSGKTPRGLKFLLGFLKDL